MKALCLLLAAVLFADLPFTTQAATLYVNANSTNPVAPYSSWATASPDIQDAINAANPGDLVLVTNGIYATGGQAIAPYRLTNRVALTVPITVQSVNGPVLTSIVGNPVMGTNAVRGAFLTNGASLIGFTVISGATETNGNAANEEYGGGVWCFSTNAVVSNCVIAGNVAWLDGGGINSGTVWNSQLINNTAGSAGGADGSFLFNSLVASNSARATAAGVLSSTLVNCTVVMNTAAGNNSVGGASSSALLNSILCSNYGGVLLANYIIGGSTGDGMSYCCTFPPTSASLGSGVVVADPLFVDGYHLSGNSPCRGAGTNAYTYGTDIDGQPWLNPPSIGCDEYYPGGTLTVAIVATATNVATNFNDYLASGAVGSQSSNLWNFGDGTFAVNQVCAWHSWAVPGQYTVTLTAYNADHPGGVGASVVINAGAQPTHYVSLSSTNPVSPYTSWNTAATNIQNAISVSSPGDVILVTNGIYQTGGTPLPPSVLTNRVAVTNPVTVQSVSGPTVTVIQGYYPPGGISSSSVRCAYLSKGASLAGFTLANGAAAPAGMVADGGGGGIYAPSPAALVSNCIVISNNAEVGAGIVGGTAVNCTVADNSSLEGGGASISTLGNCILLANDGQGFGGGGAIDCDLIGSTIASNTSNGGPQGGSANGCFLNNCTIAGNSNVASGGGICYSIANNCLLTGNTSVDGGGAFDSILYRCTLSGNIASLGGGSYGCTLSDCIISGNSLSHPSSSSAGAGAYGGVLYGCLVISNTISLANPPGKGAGAANATLYNCTVYANDVAENLQSELAQGAAASGCALYNSIICSNTESGEYFIGLELSGSANYCCGPSVLYVPGVGSITAEPIFVDAYHLSPSSPCRGAGSAAYTYGTALDGQPWLNPPSIGCAEYYAGGPLTVAIEPSYTNVGSGFPLALGSQIIGSRSAIQWNFGDGSFASNVTTVNHSWSAPGNYVVTLTAWNPDYPTGVSASVSIQVVTQPVFYVSQNNSGPVAPYGSWGTAATNIQDAVNAATIAGSLVLVTNGNYAYGGHVVAPYGLSNRVAVTIPLMVESVNGPAVTMIQGNSPVGTNAVRCVYLANWAWLVGFTLTNGATLASGDPQNEESGGGVFCACAGSVVSNCVIAGNSAVGSAGGAFQGILVNSIVSNNQADTGGGCSDDTGESLFAPAIVISNCLITGNFATGGGGGVAGGILNNCSIASNSIPSGSEEGPLGGGAFVSTMYDCVLSGNSGYEGAGAFGSQMYNCLIASNYANFSGGGTVACHLYNCTVVSNIAAGGALGGDGGGIYAGPVGIISTTIYNSIIASNYPDDYGYDPFASITLNFCCMPTLPGGVPGVGNITSSPQFVNFTNGNFQLQSNSPCINAGNNAYVTTATDLAGNPRISGGTVDIGAYEFQNPSSILSYAWLEQYGLPTDGTADYADTDNNGMNNWQKWIAGLNPTNPASILQMMPPTTSGSNVVVTWQSVTNVNYFIQRSTGLTPPSFQTIATNVPGQTGTTSYTDTNAPAPGPWFYQVGVP